METRQRKAIRVLTRIPIVDSGSARIVSTQVKPVKTNWAEPFDRKEICSNMDSILLRNGIREKHVRERMIAHAIVASGWRQSVWNYNAWGVQTGSWQGPWFSMNTIEEDADGDAYLVRDASWRAFSSWEMAIEDYFNRIRPTSKRPSYRKAYKNLVSPQVDVETDSEFWSALGDGNYYTAQKFKGIKFAVLCSLVRRILSES